jgi:hypothetical protein
MYSSKFFRGFVSCIFILLISVPASASITLYDKEGTTFTVDGSFNTFYVFSDSDNDIADPDTERQQSRVKMGFLPNWIGFNFGKQVGDLRLGGRSSFWVTINDSDDGVPGNNRLTDTGIDVRQFYGTVDADWGQLLIGKDFTLFNRANIFMDEILLGYGNVSDTLGLIDSGGVSFGNIGTGYTYPLPSAQITYRSPEINGFKLAIGLIDPSRTTTSGEENMPRFEGELLYAYIFDNGSLNAWTGFLYQESESDTSADVTSQGVSYGLRVKFADLSLTASGFTAEGVGLLTGPGGDVALGLTGLVVEAGEEVDSSGYLLQASYKFGKSRVVGSYGQNEVETSTEWENETITGAYFYSINDYLRVVAEYNVNTITVGSDEEETNTIALGGIISF